MKSLAALLLLVGVLTVVLCVKDSEGSHLGEPCPADLNNDKKVDILDVTTFVAPVRRLDTSPGNPNFDAHWDTHPGPGIFTNWININDLTFVTLRFGVCAHVKFYSKITTDGWWPSQASVLDEYAMIHHWECCQQYPQAFNGPSLTYVDYFIRTNGNHYIPGLNTSHILTGTNGAWCSQKFFPNDRYQADLRNPTVRQIIVDRMNWLVQNTSTDGIYIDVAEAWLPAAVEGCPIDDTMNAQWLTAYADLAQALSGYPLVINFQPARWFLVRDLNPSEAQRFFQAVDMVEIEHGWVGSSSDAGSLNGWNNLIEKIDYIHSLGTDINLWEYDPSHNQCGGTWTAQQRDYSLAMWFIMWRDGDHYGSFSGDGRECGESFDAAYRTNLGRALGPRQSCGSGCYTREFDKGTVTANWNSKTGVIP